MVGLGISSGFCARCRLVAAFAHAVRLEVTRSATCRSGFLAAVEGEAFYEVLYFLGLIFSLLHQPDDFVFHGFRLVLQVNLLLFKLSYSPFDPLVPVPRRQEVCMFRDAVEEDGRCGGHSGVAGRPGRKHPCGNGWHDVLPEDVHQQCLQQTV